MITGRPVYSFNEAAVVFPIAKIVVRAVTTFLEKKLFTAVGLKNNMASGGSVMGTGVNLVSYTMISVSPIPCFFN